MHSTLDEAFIPRKQPLDEAMRDTAILRIATTAYKSKAVSVYVYDGANGSKEVSKDIPPQVMGRLVGETMTDLLRSGVWVRQRSIDDDGGPSEGLPL